MSGEPIVYKVICKFNARLNFLHLRPLLCNALIRPHFDYACSAWYPNVSKKLRNKIQTSENKCIRFCLRLDKMWHISQKEFATVNWVLIRKSCTHSFNWYTLSVVIIIYFQLLCGEGKMYQNLKNCRNVWSKIAAFTTEWLSHSFRDSISINYNISFIILTDFY